MVDATDGRSVLEVAAEALGALDELDPRSLTAGELNDAVMLVQRMRCRLEAAEARVLATWDAERVWRCDGAKTGAAWLSRQQRIPIQTARQRIRHARALRTLPEVESAWSAGEIDRPHLITLLGVRTSRTAEAFEREHKDLLDVARTRGFVDFKRRCDLWEAFVDPDGAEQGADDGQAAREVHLSQSFGGMWFGRTTLDPVSGEIVHDTLVLIEQELFKADWAEAKERLGRDPLVQELRRPAPLFTVVVGYETFAGPVLELFNRRVLTPGTAARHLTEADIERVVFDSPSRVIDVGATRRFYRGALRRAIEVRDRTCFHPFCDEVPERPHIDHIHEASKGGPTTQGNGRQGCDFHNLERNSHPDDWNDAADQAFPRPDDPHAGPDPPDP